MIDEREVKINKFFLYFETKKKTKYMDDKILLPKTPIQKGNHQPLINLLKKIPNKDKYQNKLQ